jgi:hypothetical protein
MDFSAVTEPEKIIGDVRQRLANHALWQAVLFFLPPLLAFYYMIFFLHRFSWLDPDAVLIAGAALLVAGSAFAAARFRSLAPSERSVARLIDDKAAAEDRFVTLATIDPLAAPPALLSRLKTEAAALRARLEFKRDFPFRVSRSFLNSCIASLIALLLFHLALELAPLLSSTRAGGLAPIGEELARFPGLEKLADRLKTVAAQVQDPAVADEEKRRSIEELQRQIDRQLAGSERAGGRREELLSQAKNQLSGLEEGLGSGEGQGKGKGAGERQSSDQREGEGKGAADGGAAEQQNGAAPATPSAAEKNLSQAPRPAGQQQEKKAGELGGSEKKELDIVRQDQAAGIDRGRKDDKNNVESKGGSGPQDGKNLHTSSLRRPGDQGEGEALKNSRFVTVQLPEEQAASAGGKGDGGRAISGSRPPVGNLPLARPDRPNAPAEKQMLPLEYRGMIR